MNGMMGGMGSGMPGTSGMNYSFRLGPLQLVGYSNSPMSPMSMMGGGMMPGMMGGMSGMNGMSGMMPGMGGSMIPGWEWAA